MNLRLQISRAVEYYKKNGLFKMIKKVLLKIINRIFCSSKSRKLELEENKNYKIWIQENEPNVEELEKQKRYQFEYNPKISIIVPMYNTKEKYLKELIESLLNQTYSNWELCLADGSSDKKQYVDKLVNIDKRIKYSFLEGNRGISENSNAALKLATGDYFALLDHDDILPPFSLFEIVKTINENKDAEFIYTDEDKILEDKENRLGPHFKQDFAPDTLMSYNYICHFSIFKKELMERLGGFRKEFDGSQDYDLIFRATEQANKVVHIAKILYHWRINENSVAWSSDAKPYAYEAAKRAIKAHLERIGVQAEVEDSTILGMYKIKYKVLGNPKVSIIIPNKDHEKDLKRCINSILNKSTYKNYEIIIVDNNSETDKILNYYKELEKNEKVKIVKYKEKGFNYSKINNFGVQNSNGEYIVLLNNDTEIITKDWIEIMLGNCQREDVGIVGAKLLYANQTVQHCGVVLGLTGIAGHVNSGLQENEPGYMARNIISQNYSAVTGAMMMISKKDYEDVYGLDENFPVAYNDIDLCLKIRNKHKVIVMNPFVEAYHFESKTRGYEVSEEKRKRLENDANRLKNKWKKYFEKEDPYFSPNFRHDVATMRVNVNIKNELENKIKKNEKIKAVFGVIFAIIFTVMFFTYQAVITFDTASYLKLSTLLFNSELFKSWDVARGPIFPFIIRICSTFFGRSTTGLLVGMFLFYIMMLTGCFLIYKDTIKNEKWLSSKLKLSLLVLFFLLVVINPMIFGFYHIVLTEYIAITSAVISSYLAWKWGNIDYKENKLKYILYTAIFATLTAVMWLLKQPYVGTVLFPIIISVLISFIRKTNIENFVQRFLTLISCVVMLILGINFWNIIIQNGNVEIDPSRTSESYFASGIVNGIKAYDTENLKNFNTVEKIQNNEKISNEDKEKMAEVIKNESEYKSFRVIDIKEENYQIIYTKGEEISTSEAIEFWLEKFTENPWIVIESYISNYLATITVYPITFQGSRIIIDKHFNWTTTAEIDTITGRVYNYGNDNVFYLSEDLANYAAEYHTLNKPIVAINYIMRELMLPANIILKITYLLLPFLSIISLISIFLTKNKYDKRFCRIIDMITILFAFGIMHILVHSLTGTTIDRYIVPTLVTTYIGIILSIYVIINRKNYKIKK